MTEFVEWLRQSWYLLVALISGITLVWNFFSKTFKEISSKLNAPIEIIEKKLDNIDSQLNKTTSALLTMQRNSLLRSCNEFLSEGYATLEQKETIAKQYESYHDLGGDSFITDMVDKVEDLPIKSSCVIVNKEKI